MTDDESPPELVTSDDDDEHDEPDNRLRRADGSDDLGEHGKKTLLIMLIKPRKVILLWKDLGVSDFLDSVDCYHRVVQNKNLYGSLRKWNLGAIAKYRMQVMAQYFRTENIP